MNKENELLNEYFNYFDEMFKSFNCLEYPLVYEKYKNIKQEYSEIIQEVGRTNFLSSFKLILDLDAQLQIMIDLLTYYGYQDEKESCDEREILKCSESDYKSYYMEQFGYNLKDKKPHTILHFL